ncbi:MAG: HAMP domain-containing sensor histidine kinase [Elusimicrobiales bacterium]|jgi:signal transduction histidine kinase
MKIQIKIMMLVTAMMAAVVGSMILGLVAFEKRQILAQEEERVASILRNMSRAAEESLVSRDDIMLLSYLLFQMKDSPEIEICLVTRNGYTTVLGKVKSELVYRTLTATAFKNTARAAETVNIQVGFSKNSWENKLRSENASLTAIVAAISVIGLGFGFAGSWWISRKLARPIFELSAAAEKLGSGMLDAGVKAEGNDELSKLGRTFNRMASNIRKSVTAKEDLLSTLTHELNNPLAGLKAFIALLRNPRRISTIQETRQAYETMAEAVGQMELTLSNALELFRTSAKPTIDPEIVDLGDMVKEVISLYSPVARSNYITINFSAPEHVIALMADRKLLRSVIVNLLSNAVKYTPARGTITVLAEKREGSVRLSVSDTGCGINPEDQKMLFTKFYRTRGADGKKTKIPGSGLGLAIARQATELHHGKIWVESEKNKGSTFHVILPESGSGEKI